MKFVPFTSYNDQIVEIVISEIVYLKCTIKNFVSHKCIIGIKNGEEIYVQETITQVKHIINKHEHQIDFNEKIDEILK